MFSASSGSTVALSCHVPPTLTVMPVQSNLTPVTAPAAASTLMRGLHTSDIPPAVAVIITLRLLPVSFIPVSTPSGVRLTYSLSPIDHVTVLSTAFSGSTVAASCTLSPTFILDGTNVSSIVTFVTRIIGSTTVTRHSAVRPLSLVVAVITATPGATAVTMPLPSTVAISAADVLHCTVSSAFSGVIVAESCSVMPASNVVSSLLIVIPLAGIFGSSSSAMNSSYIHRR